MNKVSVCIPTFNSERYVLPTIQSVLAQTFTDFELVVNDDCSTDSTLEMIDDVHDSRLRVTKSSRRLGLVGNWNRCLELAQGEYVCILNHDDVMRSDYLEASVSMLDSHPSLGFVFSNVEYINDLGQVVGAHWSPQALPSQDTIWRGTDFWDLTLRCGNLVSGSTVLMRRDHVRRAELFDKRLYYTLDLEMWLRIALSADVGYIASPLVQLRRHPRQVTTRYANTGGDVEQTWLALQILFTEHRQSIADAENRFDQGLAHLVWWSRMQVWWALRQSRWYAAMRYLLLFIKFVRVRQQGLARVAPLARC